MGIEQIPDINKKIVNENKEEKEKSAEEILQSLEKTTSAEKIESKEILEPLLNNVINILKNEPEKIRPRDKNGNPGGLIELKEDIPTILIPDLHARREFLLNVLKNEDERGENNLKKLLNKKIQIVCLGDGMHNEEEPERWEKAWAETIKSNNPINTHIEEEMTESFGVMKMIMQLKEASPENFHYVRGNHDDTKETYGGFYKHAKESLQVKNYVLQKFGKDFLDKYAEFEENMPLVVKGSKFIASHTLPDKIINYNEIVNSRENKEDLLKSFCWSRNNVKQLGQIRNEMVNKMNEIKPTDKESRATISANYIKITQDYLAPYIKALKGNEDYSYFYGHTPDLDTLKPSCNLHHSGKQFYSNISPEGSFQIINAKTEMEKQRKKESEGKKPEKKGEDKEREPEKKKKEGPKEEKGEKEKEKEQPSKAENKKEKTVEDYVQEDIDKAKKIFDDKSLDFQKQVEVLKGVEQHLSKLLNLSPEKINLRKLTKMTPEEMDEWLNVVQIITKPEVREELNNPETQKLLEEKVDTLQKSDKEKSKKKLFTWLAKAKETTKLGGWALGAGAGMLSIFAFLIVFFGLEKLIEAGGEGKKK